MLISAQTYTAVTGAEAGLDFDAVQARCISLLEAGLRRKLVQAEITETLKVYSDGACYPSVTPIISTLVGPIVGDTILVGGPGNTWPLEPGREPVEAFQTPVTYIGGYTLATCPSDLAQAVAWGIHTLRNPRGHVETPANTTQLTVSKDFMLSLDPKRVSGADFVEVPRKLRVLAPLGGQCAVLAKRYYRRRLAA